MTRSIQYVPHKNCREVAELTGHEWSPEECEGAELAAWGFQDHTGTMQYLRPGQWLTKTDDGRLVVSDEEPK